MQRYPHPRPRIPSDFAEAFATGGLRAIAGLKPSSRERFLEWVAEYLRLDPRDFVEKGKELEPLSQVFAVEAGTPFDVLRMKYARLCFRIGGSWAAAARMVGVDVKTLYSWRRAEREQSLPAASGSALLRGGT